MKNFLRFTTLFICLGFMAEGTSSAQGPITPTDGFIGKSEMAVIWENSGYNNNGKGITFTHSAYRLKDDYELISDVNLRLNEGDTSNVMDNLGNAIITGTEGDFDGDGDIEYIVFSHGEGDTIHYALPGLTGLKYDTVVTGTLNEGPVSNLGDDFKNHIYTSSGDLDGDGKAEFVITYADKDNNIVNSVYTINAMYEPELLLTFSDEKLSMNMNSEMLSSKLADLNMDGNSELLSLFYSEDPRPGLYLKIYSFMADPDLMVTPHARQLLDTAVTKNYVDNEIDMTVDVTSGDFDGDSIQEVAAGLSVYNEPGALYVFPAKVGDDPETDFDDPFEVIMYDVKNMFYMEQNWNGMKLNMVSGDLSGNGKDEIVTTGTECQILHLDNDTSLMFTTTYLDYIWGNVARYVNIAEINNNTADGKEIVLLHDISSDFVLSVYKVDENNNPTMIVEHYLNLWGKNPGSAYLAVGDFDGDMFRIGPGKKYTKTDVVQPLVILNAPPTHFDMFDEIPYDVNNCHEGDGCESYANYTTSSSTEVAVSTTVQQSWAVSAKAKAGGKIFGAGVEGYVEGKYGKHFEKTTGSSQTVMITQSVTATYDDQIYATVCDYEIWEYVVYNVQNKPTGNIITLKPKLTENRWFPSKEQSASGYIPKHEVGNILSYTPYKDLINPDGEDKVRGSYGSDSYDLDGNTDVTFSVNLSNTFNDEVVEEREVGVEVGGSISNWGIELSGTASYDRNDLSTHSVSVGKALDITVHLGGVNRSIGETGYNVTPYIYWSKNGALVVDYAARPIMPEPGGTDTWWSSNYDIPDPAFILPWRLDPEKGLKLEDETKRTRTKSITFSPSDPKAGDVITVKAVINDFSPYPTAGKIPVSFYVGDPMNGGQLIKDINGESLFYTDDLITEQSFKTVSMKWKVPAGLASFPRIYAYIDPQNVLTEVHEENNIGWAILGKSEEGGSTPVQDLQYETGMRTVIYPNPFSNTVALNYSLDRSSDVRVSIYDLQGQMVYTTTKSAVVAGDHDLQLPLNDLSAGMYLYKVKTAEFTETGRLVKTE
ncbi:T9SS type A sorting domain-containing protein [Saccharicrinis sp. FJH62]|uniref:T9SS type A sorting domain-containing protein n=1 Tax=Saccharicrinis sp. FJH62 TaxID=3344657 RepID=UPI0035D47C8F